MKRFVPLLLAAAAAFLMPACSPQQSGLILDTSRVSPASLAALLSRNDNEIRSLAGTGTISFESPDLAGSVFFSVALRKPDSLLVRFEGPFGMDVGFLFVSRDRYVMYNAMQNQVIRGIPTAGGIRNVIPIDLTFDQLLDAFTGTFRLPANATAPGTYQIEDDCYHLVYPGAGGTASYWVDPGSATVAKFRMTDSTGTVVEAETSMPQRQDSLTAPRAISVTFPGLRRQLSIYYAELTLNADQLSFRYSIPSSARPGRGR